MKTRLTRRQWLTAGALAVLSGAGVQAAPAPTDRFHSLQVAWPGTQKTQSVNVWHAPGLPTPQKNQTLILYVLDADLYFSVAVSYAQFLQRSRLSGIASCCVVGIVSDAHRTDSFTPSASAGARDGSLDTTQPAVGGQADAFSRFLTHTLCPAVECRLAQTPSFTRRLLMGHSLGGLFVLYQLSRPEPFFDDFIAVDPSVWWDQGRFAAQLSLPAGALSGQSRRRLYSAFATLPRSTKQFHLTQATNFQSRTAARLRSAGLPVFNQNFDQENHGTVAYPAFFDGLKRLYCPTFYPASLSAESLRAWAL